MIVVSTTGFGISTRAPRDGKYWRFGAPFVTELDSYRAIFRDLVALWATAPLPPQDEFSFQTRESRAGYIGVVIAWGWMVRTSRTGEAALNLEQQGFSEEAAPLIRTMLEHTIRLRWAVTSGPQFVEVLARMRAKSFDLLTRSQFGGDLGADLVAQLEEAASSHDEAFRHLDVERQLLAIVKKDPESLGRLYQAWLVETQFCHPTMTSAEAYISSSDSGVTKLLRKPTDNVDRALHSSLALLSAVDSYRVLAGLNESFETRLNVLNGRWAALNFGEGQVE